MVLPLLIIVASWILVLAVVAGLCFSARQGDLEQLRGVPADPASDPFESAPVSLRITAVPAFDSPQITASALSSAPRTRSRTTQPSRRTYPCDPLGITGSTAG